MTKNVPRKITSLIIISLLLVSIIMNISFLPTVNATVSGITVTPSAGYVGDSVNVVANITTDNGGFTVLFDNNTVHSGNAIDKLVNVSFSIPYALKGAHNITVRDETGEATASFTVLAKYSIIPQMPESPGQLQQNGTLDIILDLTGGESSIPSANITVRTPANTTYWLNLSLTGTTDIGHYNVTITYPNVTWTAPTANTNYTGAYNVSWLDGTTLLGSETFTIGLTNLTEYHRGDSVGIKAVDYTPGENVTITISSVGFSYSIPSSNATVDADGVVQANWTVASDAPIGNYRLSITPVPTSKSAANDTQIFEVPGFRTEVFTRNLANKAVPNIFVKVRDESTNLYYNATSNSSGIATVRLESGSHSGEVFFNRVKIGDAAFAVIGEGQVNVTCLLSSAIISVVDAQDTIIPFVSVVFSYNYTTNLDVVENRTGTYSGETNITGILQFDSLLTNITYNLNASRYGQVFNEGNNTITSFPAVAYENVTVMCPANTIHVKVIGSNDQPIAGMPVYAQELMGGMEYSNTTDSEGMTDLSCPFGRYSFKVYSEEILLNETIFDLFQEQNGTIKCQLYGLAVTIVIVDYFGQPIPNKSIILLREGLTPRSGQTQSDGTITFSNIIGGDMQIALYLTDEAQPYITRNVYVDKSMTIAIKLENYVMLFGFMVETIHLITALIIVMAIVFLVSIEIYRRQHAKSRKTES